MRALAPCAGVETCCQDFFSLRRLVFEKSYEEAQYLGHISVACPYILSNLSLRRLISGLAARLGDGSRQPDAVGIGGSHLLRRFWDARVLTLRSPKGCAEV